MSDVKHSPVVDFGILCQAAAELYGVPGVKVGIEV